MPTLNGETYEMQYLTDEEAAVINAMRMGGKVEVNFFGSNNDCMNKSLDSLDENLFDYHHTAEQSGFFYYEKQSEHVKIGHYIDK